MNDFSGAVSVAVSMAAFSLAACITPGPSNIVGLSFGSQFGVVRSQRHVLGSAAGFSTVIMLTGFGLHEVLTRWPGLTEIIRWVGTAFLVYLAWKIASDNGELSSNQSERPPAIWQSLTVQCLSPKSWMVSAAGVGAFASNGKASTIWIFCSICFLVCYFSAACWVYAGACFRRYLNSPARIRRFNIIMALILATSAISLFFS